MTSPLDPQALAGRWEALGLRIEAGEAGPDELRSAIEAMRSGAGGTDDSPTGQVLARMALMAEVWECIAAESPDRGEAIAGFLAEAFLRLTSGLQGVESGDAVAAILGESAERWGEYLALVDPDWIPEAPPTPDEVADDDLATAEEPWPEIDPSELLRRLTGAAMEQGEHQPSRDSTPIAPPPPQDPKPPRVEDSERATSSRPTRSLDLPPELLEAFLADANELFDRIQDLVLGLGGVDDDAHRLRELGRCYHTLKGAAGSVGLADLAASVHTLEDRLEQSGGTVSGDLAQSLEGSLNELETVLSALRHTGQQEPARAEPDEPLSPSIEAPIAKDPGGYRGSGSSEPTPLPGEPEGFIRVPSGRFEELTDLCSELIARRQSWADQAESVKQFAATTRTCSRRLRAIIDRADVPGARASLEEHSATMRRLSEQADDLAALATAAREAALPMIDEGETLARLCLQLWDTLQSIRIVPVRGLFQRLTRVARDAARAEGRTIEIAMVGEETGADRPLLDKLFEPLLHVARNAVCHGIEPPEDRTRAGKPPQGRITLEARREGNTLVLAVQDDGRGLDDAAIAAKARRLGLLAPDESPSPDRLRALIFQPGFSTRQEADAIAGRGIGMDVVAREVGLLRGRIELDSKPGHGTRLTLRLPARLALEQVMIARVAGQAIAVPISAVESIHRADEAEPADPDGAIVRVGGHAGHRIDLHRVLGLPKPARGSCPTLLIARADGVSAAVLVDGVDGARELVIRPLGPLLAGHPAFTGTSLTAGGEIVLVLDLAGLSRLAACEATGRPPEPDHDGESAGPAALVVDDSLSVRRVASTHLRTLGYDVDEANDGEQAIGKLRDRTYRLVLTDLEMPRMDGFELLAELRRTGQLDTIPVIMSSTRSDLATRRRALELGAGAFLAKPVSAEALSRVIASLPCPWERTAPGCSAAPAAAIE